MLKTFGSVIMIIGGIFLIIYNFYDNHKKTMKLAIKNNNEVNKYLKYKRLLDVITGSCFLILGVISILNLYKGDLLWILCIIIILLDKIIEFRIYKNFRL